jgi:hypothetical protein
MTMVYPKEPGMGYLLRALYIVNTMMSDMLPASNTQINIVIKIAGYSVKEAPNTALELSNSHSR